MVEYDNFFEPWGDDHASHTITDSDIELARRVKHHISDDSSYYDHMLEWRLEDNNDVISSPEEMGRVYVTLHFATMVGIMSDDFIKENNVKDYHIDLLRNLYLDFSDNNINMGFKRPFGNSYVLGDVASSMKKYGYDIYDDQDDIDEDEANRVLLEFVDILSKFVKDFQLKFKSFKSVKGSGFGMRKEIMDKWKEHITWVDRVHTNLYKWEIDKMEIRGVTLDKILNDTC